MARRGESKYDGLGEFLVGLDVDRVELSFAEIEEITGEPLTPSQRKYDAAWANTDQGGSVMHNQWLRNGWRVQSKSLAGERVVFVREVPDKPDGGSRRPSREPAVWWVNQRGRQYQIDRARGYRWSPSKTQSGGVREAWRCLEDMREGDVWLNYQGGAIVAIGTVIAAPEPFEWPEDQDNQKRYPGAGGCRVWFENHDIAKPIQLTEIPDDWKRKAGPFRENLWVRLSSVEPVDAEAAAELRQRFLDRWPEESPWGRAVPTIEEPARAPRYWINKHTPESWDRFLQGGIDVVTASRPRNRIRPGDVFVNYVSGDGGRWVSAERVISDARRAEDKPYADYDSVWEWEVKPATERLSLVDGVVVRDRVGRLELFRGHESNWGGRLIGGDIELPESDAELIVGWIDARSIEGGC